MPVSKIIIDFWDEHLKVVLHFLDQIACLLHLFNVVGFFLSESVCFYFFFCDVIHTHSLRSFKLHQTLAYTMKILRRVDFHEHQ